MRLLTDLIARFPLSRYFTSDVSAQIFAVISVLLAFLLKAVTDQWVSQEQSPFLIFPAAIMVSAWYGGWKGGLVSTVLSTLLVNWFYLAPHNTIWVSGIDAYIQLSIFLAEGGLICLLAERLNQNRLLAQRRADEAFVARRIATERAADLNRAQLQLTARDAMFRRLVDANVVGVIVCQLDGRIIDANTAFLEMVELTQSDLLAGRVNWKDLTPPEFAALDLRLIDELHRTHRFEAVEKEYVTASGRRVPIWLGGASFPEDDKVICFVMDLTIQKQAANAMEQAKEAAERANRARGEFLANVSHELRTPMNAILGMTELALDEELPGAVRDYLETSVEAARTLLYLLNDLLDFSRIEAGRIELEAAPFSLRNTLDQAMRILGMRAAEKGLELTCSTQAELPDALLGDQGRLRQIVINLVGNAVKFTESGEVVVDVSPQANAAPAEPNATPVAREVALTLTIKDTGIGISEEQQTHIFEPFTQGDSSPTREHGGTGLGLAIVRQLVERMGGDITVESQLGMGAAFRVNLRFPLASPDAMPEQYEQERRLDLRGLTVLAIDDNQSNRRILENILRSWSMQPCVVADGLSALQEMREAQRQQREFDVILVDALMPAMDGLQLIRSATTEGLLRGAAIVMISASDRQSLEPELKALPIAGVLAKPISQSDLLDTLMDALHGPSTDLPETSQIRVARRQLHVLVAEDAPANRKVVRTILEKRGHVVTLVANGREAVSAVAREAFDVVLMDVQMPQLDGWQATRQIRQLPVRSRTPILAITAHAMRGDREKCLAAGMNDYISKPIDAHELIRTVERLAGKAPGMETWSAYSPSKSESRPRERRKAQETTTVTSSSPQSLLDREGSLRRMGGDEALLIDMARYFLQDAPGLFQTVETDGATEVAFRAAHSIRGLAANFGALPIVAIATKLESPEESEDQRAVHIAELKSLLDRFYGELHHYVKQHGS